MAHIEERGKNCYRIKVYLGKDGQGEKDYYYEVFHGPKKAARSRAIDIENQVNKKTFVRPAKITVAEHFRRWLAYNEPPEVRETTYNMYEYISRVHIVPALGNVPLDKLMTTHILDFMRAVRTGPRKDGKPGRLSSSTVKHIYDVLHVALEAAVEWRLIPRGTNPMDCVKPPTVEDKEMAAWDPRQARAFLDALSKDKYFGAYLLAISGGLRRGEILGLRWQDIDWDGRKVSLNQQVIKTKGGKRVQGELKTRRSRRTVTVSHEVVEALKQRQVAVTAEKTAYESVYGPGAYADLGLVFANEVGQPLNPDTFGRGFRRAVKRLGLPRLRLHDTRHTSATLMVAAGTHPKVMAERLGDRVETVLSMYAHALPGLQGEVADDIDQVLSGSEEADSQKIPTRSPTEDYVTK